MVAPQSLDWSAPFTHTWLFAALGCSVLAARTWPHARHAAPLLAAEGMALAAHARMLLSRMAFFGVAALGLSLAAGACDGSSANKVFSSPPPPSGSDHSDGDGSDTAAASAPVAALSLSACVPAGYTVPLSIAGSEPFDVTVDTGSTSIGVASESCSGCDVKPKFSPSDEVVDRGVEAKSQYVTGAWSGEVYEGDVSLAPRTQALVRFVAIEKQDNFFVPQTCQSKSGHVQGIMGLGPATGALEGTNGFLDQFIAQAKAPDVFATKLCDDGGTLWLGGYDARHATTAPQYTPLIKGVYHSYAVRLDHVEIDGIKAPVASTKYPSTIVDTGASAFLLARSAFTPVTKAIAANAKFKELVGEDASWFDNPDGQSCKDLSATKEELDAALPPLEMTFGTGADAIAVHASPTESYLGQYEGHWCSTLVAFDPTDDLRIASIMGAPLLRSNIVIFDREKDRIGFAPHTACK